MSGLPTHPPIKPGPALAAPASNASLRAAWWLHGAVVALAITAVLLALHESTASMFSVWMRSQTFAHAIVVPPIALWLAWRQRVPLLATVPRADARFLLPMLPLALLWFAGRLAEANAAQHLALMGLVICTVPMVIGWAASRVILFPLGFLLFAVPIGDFLTPWLMRYTADFTVTALRLTGIPVYREGQQFVIPSGHWSVVEACSGIRYLMASLMAGTLFAYLNFRAHWRRWVFVGISILVPIVANWVRAYMIVMLGHLSNNRIAVGVDHLIYGWVFFGIVIMGMFFFGARWREPESETAAPAPMPAAPALVAADLSARRLWATLALFLGLGLAAGFGARQVLGAPSAAAPAVPSTGLVLPDAPSTGWTAAPTSALPNWTPSFIGEPAFIHKAFSGASAPAAVGLYLYHGPSVEGRRKLVSSENMLVRTDETEWHQINRGYTALPEVWPQGRVVATTLQELGGYALSGSHRRQLRIWDLYWIDGRFVSGDPQAMLALAWQRLMGRPDGGAHLLIYTVADTEAEADRRLAEFFRANAAALEAPLRALRTGAPAR